MIKIVGVRFRNAGKVYYFDPKDYKMRPGDHVIVETARGIEYGTVTGKVQEVADDKVVQPLKPVIRVANEEDDTRARKNREREREAMSICKEKIRKHNLDMKLIDAEYTFDNNKVLFYFTADGRIDFRELVKDLAAVFRTRIELRQIGVRDETKILGGVGICGRPLCCSTFLSEFAPVSIRMAKEQNLSLNPTKISGVCGRLMCCLKNEEETYEYLNSKLPGIGDAVITASGLQGEVTGVSVLRQKVKVLVNMDDEKELQEYDVSELKFKPRRKKEKGGERQNRGDKSQKGDKNLRGEHGLTAENADWDESVLEAAELLEETIPEVTASDDIMEAGADSGSETAAAETDENVDGGNGINGGSSVNSGNGINGGSSDNSDNGGNNRNLKNERFVKRRDYGSEGRYQRGTKGRREERGEKNGYQGDDRAFGGDRANRGQKNSRTDRGNRENRAYDGNERRSDRRSDGRFDQQAENRTESRREGRSENRTDSRWEGRSENRTENRSEGRPENRTESRSEGRPENRTDSRSENRWEGRPEKRWENRKNNRSGNGKYHRQDRTFRGKEKQGTDNFNGQSTDGE